MTPDYENLGFEVKVNSDDAVTRLDKIIEKLEKIQKLGGTQMLGGNKPTYNNSETKKLSEIEKYEKRIAKATELIEDKEYKRIRTEEILNKETKKRIDQEIKQKLGIKDNTNALGKYLAKLTSVVVVAKKLAHFMSGAIKESAEYIESLNLFAVAYGKTYEQQLDWALGIAEAYGLANNEVIKFAGTFRELSTSLGLVSDTADLVSKTVTNLGYDLSALFNTTVEQAMDKLQSGVFSGNVRPLRAYGIDISQNQIDALFETNQALKQLGVNARNLSQSDKVIARLIITLQSGKDSFGTMAREINNLQSQFRIFQGSISNFKLAIGDLIEEPLSRVMVLVNAFIIAMTNVIRTFVPLQKEDATPKAIINTAMGAEEASEALDELNGKLASFDKFNVLQQGGENTNLAVTEQLNKMLQEQANLYDQELSTAMENMQNEAVELAKKLQDVVVIGGTLIAIFAISKFVAIKNSIKMISEGFKLLSGSTVELNKGLSLTNTLLITGIVYAIYKAVEAFRAGDTAGQVLYGTIAFGLLVAWGLLNKEMIATVGIKIGKFFSSLASNIKATTQILFSFNKISLGSTALAVTSLTIGFVGLAGAVAGAFAIFANWNDMSSWQQVIGIIGVATTAILGLAMAFGAFHSAWSLGLATAGIVAGITAIVASVATVKKDIQQPVSYSAHENGGYTNANLIMTHENGKREWVGRASGSTAIVNDTQMSDIMEGAVAKGVFSAMRANSSMGRSTPTNETIVVKIGEEAVFNAVRKTAKKQGVDFATV